MDIGSLISHPKPKGSSFTIKSPLPSQWGRQSNASSYGTGVFHGLGLLADVAMSTDGLSKSPSESSVSVDSFSVSSSSIEKKADESDYDDPNVKPKRKRANAMQVEVLKKTFQQSPFPSTDVRRKLAKQLGMTARSVQIWFQNQRQLARNLVPLHSDGQ